MSGNQISPSQAMTDAVRLLRAVRRNDLTKGDYHVLEDIADTYSDDPRHLYLAFAVIANAYVEGWSEAMRGSWWRRRKRLNPEEIIALTQQMVGEFIMDDWGDDG